jgi:hypothetical protein
VMPYSPVEVYTRFGGRYCIHLQGRRSSNQQDAAPLARLLHFDLDAAGSIYLRNVVKLLQHGLHGVISHKILIFCFWSVFLQIIGI